MFAPSQIFQLEGDLRAAQKAAGLPVQMPAQETSEKLEAQLVAAVSQSVRSKPNVHGRLHVPHYLNLTVSDN